mgnify:CR=1 FL=1
MVAAVRVHKTGGPEVLTFEQIDIPAPGQGQIKLKQHACGVNYIDTYFRMGMYPSPVGLPFTSGNEGAGEVIAVGPGVTDIKVGDRVGYVVALGGYAQERVMPADRAVKLPDSITYEQAAAMMLKGMTAQYLLRRTYNVKKGDTILVHAAAGGVGVILCQWGAALGATVIGTVGDEEKAKIAKELGLDYEHIPVEIGDAGARTPEFLAINPNGRLPAIVDDCFVLVESLAITLYLTTRLPKNEFPSSDRSARIDFVGAALNAPHAAAELITEGMMFLPKSCWLCGRVASRQSCSKRNRAVKT